MLAWLLLCAKSLFFYSPVDAEPCQGSVILKGTKNMITDSRGNNWTIAPGDIVHKNGEVAGIAERVIMLVYVNQVIYKNNYNPPWGWSEWKWDPDGWKEVKDPFQLAMLLVAGKCVSTTSTRIPGNSREKKSFHSNPTSINMRILAAALCFTSTKSNWNRDNFLMRLYSQGISDIIFSAM